VLATTRAELETQVAPTPGLPQPPPEPAPPAGVHRDQRATAALVLGIFSLGSVVLSCVPLLSIIACGGPMAAVAAIVLGAIVRRDIGARGGLAEDRKRAQLGLVLGIVGLVLYAVVILFGFALGIGMGLLEAY
jgi:hypothetical protein